MAKSKSFQQTDVDTVISSAAAAFIRNTKTDAIDDAIGVLVGKPAEAVDSALLRSCSQAVESAWRRGWQPADLVYVVKRRLGTVQVPLLVDVLAENAKAYDENPFADPVWMGQLESIGAQRWWDEAESLLAQWQIRNGVNRVLALEAALQLFAVVNAVEQLPTLRVPPSAWSASMQRPGAKSRAALRPETEKMLTRVRALLTKAESTTFAQEAESLTVKAQQLMTRHAIDQAMLESHGDVAALPESRRLGVDDPYARAKTFLLNNVAMANDCKVVWMDWVGLASVFGFEADLDTTELLYTSLLVQCTTAMISVGQTKDIYGRTTTRSFRQSFMVSFAARIGDRLMEAREAGHSEAAADYAGELLPVLASRQVAVEEALAAAHPNLKTSKQRATNHEGWIAGAAAADESSLQVRAQIKKRSRR